MNSPKWMFVPPYVLWTWVIGLLASYSATRASYVLAEDTPRPNVIWIMSEDNSKHYLKHFDPNGVSTPAIEALAEGGITFDRAFSNAPVCSVARTTLITGCYGPRIGTQFHRKTVAATLPTELEMFPHYLREAGYYTSNSSKTDYNATIREQPWDESSRKASWTKRPTPETPFFHVETHTDSHEIRLHFKPEKTEEATDFSQADVHLPNYFPDTPLFRFTAAYYRDRMKVIDGKVAATVAKLKEEGQLENTFIFYFGDHGGVLPRSKGYLFESGLHVPLVVRIPENFRSLVDRPQGTRTKGFVSFIDFAPTVLNLAGVTIPETIDGQAFMGPGTVADEVDQRATTFGYADRMDAKYDVVRSVRIGDWKYIRYFESHYPNSFWNDYRYKMLAYQEWADKYEAGELSAEQSAFFRPRPVEALFDLSEDPDETNNLASSAEQSSRLIEMRKTLSDHLKATNDLSFFTESVIIREGIANPVALGTENSDAIATYIDTANIAVRTPAQATASLLGALNSGDPLVRYWALTAACSMTGSNVKTRKAIASDDTIVRLARRRTLDTEPLVAARAAELLNLLSDEDPREVIYRCLEQASSIAEALQILNMAVYLHTTSQTRFEFDPKKMKLGFKVNGKSDLSQRLDYFRSPDQQE